MSSRMTIVIGAVALWGGSPGCDNECTPDGDPPTLALGTGERAFEPLDGDPPSLDIVMGPQGGYHVIIGLEATRMNARELMIAELAASLDDAEVGVTRPWVQMRCNPRTKTLQAWNHFLIFETEAPETLGGEVVRISATLTDQDGRSVSAEEDVELVW